jgi:hypothetical protein|tara:strand:- start:666 stop:899 length:234 start_codon:yes stop_codon:yes gene_type:complete
MMEDESITVDAVSVDVASVSVDTDEKSVRKRKSLAVDETTYEMLSRICAERRRSKIQQLQVLIEAEFYALNLDGNDS